MSQHRHAGFGFVEIIIAVSLVAACAVPVFYMVNTTRTDTTKAINYLRAMELANEVIEWASASVVETTDGSLPPLSVRLSALNTSLINDMAGGLVPVEVAVEAPENPEWRGFALDKLSYSEQYNNAFFYREVTVAPVDRSYFESDLLQKVTVTVKWCEGRRPASLNVPGDRDRQIELSFLVLNEHHLAY